MLIELISKSLSRAYIFEETQIKKHYIEGTSILNHERFKTILNRKFEAYNQFGTPYTLLKVDFPNKDLFSISHVIINQIRETDYIGIDENNNIYILLSNTKAVDSNLLIERLANNNISSELLNTEESKKCLALL